MLSWEDFRSENNGDPTAAFERLARHYFAHSVGVHPRDIAMPLNFAGVESVPVQTAKGLASFQSKFFANDVVNFDKFLDSAKKAASHLADQLDVVHLITNGCATVSSQTGGNKGREAVEKTLTDAGIEPIWLFGDSLLADFTAADRAWVVNLREQFFATRRDPPLATPTPSHGTSLRHALHFAAKDLPLTERESDVRAIQDLCDNDSRFAWIVIIGPASSGKSRLAFEAAELVGDGWRTCWIEGGFDFSQWTP